MGLFDNYQFAGYGGQGGGLLDIFRMMQSVPTQQPQGFPQERAALPPQAQPAQQMPPPPQMQMPQGPGIGDRMMAGFQGLANAGSPMQALGNLVGGLATGQRSDPAGMYQQQSNLTLRALVAAGASPQEAVLAQSNPEIMKMLFQRLRPQKEFKSVGGTAGAWDGNNFTPQYTEPKYETVAPGNTLYRTGGLGPPQAVASGGPDKPPAGFQHIDPKDPSKGLTAIPGGPATHLAVEAGSRIAMMDESLKGFLSARKELERPWNASDRVMAAANAGDIGRAQRVVRSGIEAALRAMTGAAAPEAEVKRYMDMYMPGQLDTPQTAKQKLDLLEGFMRRAKSNAMQGRTSAPTTSDPLGLR